MKGFSTSLVVRKCKLKPVRYHYTTIRVITILKNDHIPSAGKDMEDWECKPFSKTVWLHHLVNECLTWQETTILLLVIHIEKWKHAYVKTAHEYVYFVSNSLKLETQIYFNSCANKLWLATWKNINSNKQKYNIDIC